MATKSKNSEQVTFSSAIARTREICSDHPEMFEQARLALQEWDNGKYTLIGAVTAAIQRAHEAGLKGKTLPRLSIEEIRDLSAMREVAYPGARATLTGYAPEDLIQRAPARPTRTIPRTPPAPVVPPTRVGRSLPVAAPATVKRFSRS